MTVNAEVVQVLSPVGQIPSPVPPVTRSRSTIAGIATTTTSNTSNAPSSNLTNTME